MSQPIWEVHPRSDGWTVVHTPSKMRAGICFGHEEALHVAEALNRDLPTFDVLTAHNHHADLLRAILGAAMRLRPKRELNQFLAVVTIKIPVWARDKASTEVLLQSMLENDEIYSYTDEFEPELSVTEIVNTDGTYNEPAYAVTTGGLEEVERLPYVPIKATTGPVSER